MAETSRQKSRLGSFIRECRNGLKYTSRQVARLSIDRGDIPSISNSYLISVENGKHIPRLDKVIALADLLNVPITHFVDRCREDLGGKIEAPAEAEFGELFAAARERAEMNDHGKALAMFRMAQQKARELNGAAAAAQVTELRLEMANSYRCLKITRVAKDEIESVLKDTSISLALRARASWFLAEIHRDEGNPFLGRIIAQEALRLSRAAEDEGLEAKLLSTLGKFAVDQEELDEALPLFREAAAKNEKLGNTRSALMARIHQGLLLVVKREYFKAADLLKTELNTCQENDPYVRGSLHMGLAKAYFGAENYRSARTHSRTARDCADKLEDPSLQFLSTYYLWQVARRERSGDSAAMHFEKMKYFRNKLEVEFDEVSKFDRYMKQARDAKAASTPRTVSARSQKGVSR